MKFKKNVTVGEKYFPAMEIQKQDEADKYFEALVVHNMSFGQNDRKKAEEIERINLGYYAGYFDNKTRIKVENLFRCTHPILGSASDGVLTTLEIIELGKKVGASLIAKEALKEYKNRASG